MWADFNSQNLRNGYDTTFSPVFQGMNPILDEDPWITDPIFWKGPTADSDMKREATRWPLHFSRKTSPAASSSRRKEVRNAETDKTDGLPPMNQNGAFYGNGKRCVVVVTGNSLNSLTHIEWYVLSPGVKSAVITDRPVASHLPCSASVAAHLPLSRKCPIGVLPAAAHSHINSLSRQTAAAAGGGRRMHSVTMCNTWRRSFGGEEELRRR